MSEFRVVPKALDSYAGVLSSGGSAVDLDTAFGTTARTYVDTYVPIDSSPSDLFRLIYGSNEPVLRHLRSAMPQIQRLYSQSAQALHASATTYRNTDTAVSRNLDGTWPGGLGALLALSDPASSGSGLVDPRPLLAGAPDEDAPVPDAVQWIIDKAG